MEFDWISLLAAMGGALGSLLGSELMVKYGSEARWRRELFRIAALRGWDWLATALSSDPCPLEGYIELKSREQLASRQVQALGKCLDRVRALTYHDRLAFGPAHLGAGEQLIRVDFLNEDGLLEPVAVVSGHGPWTTIPLAEATPEAVLQALGPPDPVPLAWLLARATDEQLQSLPGAQRTALVHALIREDELPAVVEGLVERFQKRRAS